ncbi:sun-family protein, putative [Plasmodium vivax]|uniref:Sun-family protein, putative n=6 Tax=Plasmodium vivax TaxID=5855 RepID=A5K0A7_PLAVS|nr:sun-family protein, putative [Plasmodium vivax]KMZ77718.1 sun-family protein [Plasmodium vivax India VII]KMZ84562.1 sun-family protein [Plasmodium vivax Brazil I]KMZ90341.1 sun-family protein [Plasmodium vivax Mauritania I]KMZ96694.1 sun-family protein [Plasmodium vivax North Korean]EDL47668.1 sun-family protein, putative [Plasmodium vivax]|eukprot:XP_001617395.1 sun-family protein [Plasmodium vivax Sal-1]
MNSGRLRHIENALNSFNFMSPLDIYMRLYFKANSIKSKDKPFISDHVYNIIRNKTLLSYLSAPSPLYTSVIKTYFASDRWKYEMNNEKIPAHVRYSFPKELYEQLVNCYGEKKSHTLMSILNEKAPVFLRVNTNKISRNDLYKLLMSKGVSVEKCVNSPQGLLLTKSYILKNNNEYRRGFFEMQDEASQIVSSKIPVQPGYKVLDFCAGSGGKTLAFSPKMENTGKVYLHDVRDKMLSQAKVRLRRAGIQNYILLHSNHILLNKLVGCMDTVIVDAPCTGTGALRRNPEMKHKYTNGRLYEYVNLQREIFQRALLYLKKNGKIAYITCSILDAENVHQAKYFCEKHNLFLSEPPFHSLPQSKSMDGFFLAIFERRE